MVVDAQDELHPHPRITFTFPAIAKAQLALITVAGIEKREAVARLRAGEDLPAARVRARRVLWLLDAAANGE
jgi:6-phosphogluconolactonase